MSIKYRVLSIKLILLLLTLNTYYLIPNTVAAATPTATPSADIKSKLQALQAEIASRAAMLKSEVGKKLQNRAFVGFVKSKSATSLTLATKSGSKIVNINEDTEYLSEVKSKVKFSAKTLSNDDYLATLGDMDESEVISAKRVIKLNPPSVNPPQILWGVVTEMGGKIFIKSKEDKLLTVITNIKTEYQFGKTEGEKANIKIQKPLIVIGEKSGEREIKAKFIYILPYTTAVKKVASPSASPTIKAP